MAAYDDLSKFFHMEDKSPAPAVRPKKGNDLLSESWDYIKNNRDYYDAKRSTRPSLEGSFSPGFEEPPGGSDRAIGELYGLGGFADKGAAPAPSIGPATQKIVKNLTKVAETRAKEKKITAPQVSAMEPNQGIDSSMATKAVDAMTSLISNPQQHLDEIDESQLDEALKEMQIDEDTLKSMHSLNKWEFVMEAGLRMMALGGQPGAGDQGVLGIMGASALGALGNLRKGRAQIDAEVQKMDELNLRRLEGKEKKDYEIQMMKYREARDDKRTAATTSADLYKAFMGEKEHLETIAQRDRDTQAKIQSAEIRARAKGKNLTGRKASSKVMEGLFERDRKRRESYDLADDPMGENDPSKIPPKQAQLQDYVEQSKSGVGKTDGMRALYPLLNAESNEEFKGLLQTIESVEGFEDSIHALEPGEKDLFDEVIRQLKTHFENPGQ